MKVHIGRGLKNYMVSILSFSMVWCFSALTVLVRWLEEHPTYSKSHISNGKSSLRDVWGPGLTWSDLWQNFAS